MEGGRCRGEDPARQEDRWCGDPAHGWCCSWTVRGRRCGGCFCCASTGGGGGGCRRRLPLCPCCCVKVHLEGSRKEGRAHQQQSVSSRGQRARPQLPAPTGGTCSGRSRRNPFRRETPFFALDLPTASSWEIPSGPFLIDSSLHCMAWPKASDASSTDGDHLFRTARKSKMCLAPFPAAE